MIDTSVVTDENVDDMMDAGGYGITYWADRATDEEWDAARAELLRTKGQHPDFLVVEAYDERKVYPLTYDDIRKAYAAFVDLDQKYVAKWIHDYFIDSWRNRTEEDGIDAGFIDATAGDVLIQVACFGEVVYG